MIARQNLIDAIDTALRRSPVVVLSGPRQCGKTTLARELLSTESLNYFDLEDPASIARLEEPMTALAPLIGLVVIDEVQLRADLFSVLRVLVDRRPLPARFLILGSASGELLRQSSESLAGRTERILIGGFTPHEVASTLGPEATNRLWHRGGFPISFLARTTTDSRVWRANFIRTLLERDMPNWGVRIPAATLLRFWTTIAYYHGQIWSRSEPARVLGVSESTVRRYLDLLTDAMVIRQLQPWHANLKKRQVKSPKIYIRDSGILHQLLGIDAEKALLEHPKSGASWEGFVIEQVLATEPHDEAWFWATHQGAEIDLLLQRGSALFGIECKRIDAPRMTKSIRIAIEDLSLEAVAILYPGTKRYSLADNVEAVPLSELARGRAVFH